jgi:hypothetical protein
MRFIWDIETGNLVQSVGDRTPISQFEFKRGDTRDDELIFVRNGQQYDPEAALVKFGIKLPGATQFLVSTSAFSKTGSGATAVWTFSPSFNTEELNTALNIGGTGAELTSIAGDLEFEYTLDGFVVSTKTFPCRIARDINRGDEGIVTFANPVYPTPAEIELIENKNVPNGYAGLNANAKIDAAQLPNSDSITEGSTNLFFTNTRARAALPDAIGIAVSDEGTELATGSANLTFRMPYAITLTSVRASVNTAPDGDDIEIDIKRNGTSIFSTLLSIDDGEKTSVTAATPAVLSTTSLADDDEIVVSIEQVGSTEPGRGLKLWLKGTRA